MGSSRGFRRAQKVYFWPLTGQGHPADEECHGLECVVVTRGGAGDLWRFASSRAADLHALSQYGDAFLTGPQSILRTFRSEELASLARRLQDERLAREIERFVERTEPERIVDQLWARMLELASPPPDDPAEVLRIVAGDRERTLRDGVVHREHPEKETEEVTTAEKTKKTRPVPRTAKFKDESVITMGKNKEGVQYGKDNNPKREGSDSAKRFALYKDGMTVRKALDAGITRGDLNWDAKQKFIKIA